MGLACVDGLQPIILLIPSGVRGRALTFLGDGEPVDCDEGGGRGRHDGDRNAEEKTRVALRSTHARLLLVLGATSAIRFAKPERKGVSPWLLKLLERKPRKLAAVALANKMAPIVWAMLARGECFRRANPMAA